MKQFNVIFFIIVLFLSACNVNKTVKEIKKPEPEVVGDSEYMKSFVDFHFSHREVVKIAAAATIDFMNNKNFEVEYKTALKELRESTKQMETLPLPADDSELKDFAVIYRNAILELPDSLESIVFYQESGDQDSLDAAIDTQSQLGADIDYAANQILGRRSYYDDD
ncbi:hypothetical protein D1B31_04795 [Neobacillus notoginsengisoli]|uniref:Lipoprotein n=1 Tax=Neobacillus notoginsengisoli TaxID=1578198 RepID=A0A417YWJ5_9BACI|nr:hypothetical protein [Neobacillus notoginsengisoli]RHW41967.1 hypothetical protein D1B31_04795 [Neobacillus notoginsengisoli]